MWFLNAPLGLDFVPGIPTYSVNITEAGLFGDSLTQPWPTIVWLEALGLSDSLNHQMVGSENFSDAMLLAEAITFGQHVSLTDSLLASDDLTSTLGILVQLSEILSLAIVQDTKGVFFENLVSAVTLSDAFTLGQQISLADAATFADALTDWVGAVVEIADELTLSDSFTNTLALFISLSDGLDLSDSLSHKAVFELLLSDGILLGGDLNLGGQEYVAWVLNPKADNAFSSYTNYPFNSFIALGQNAYGLAEDGIYSLEGTDDDGTDIDVRLKGGLMDFGESALKNLRYGYFGLSTDGDLLLRVTDTSKGYKTESYYRLVGRNGDTMFEQGKRFSNSIQARYWQFEVQNFEGSELNIDEIEWHAVMLRRRGKGKGNG